MAGKAEGTNQGGRRSQSRVDAESRSRRPGRRELATPPPPRSERAREPCGAPRGNRGSPQCRADPASPCRTRRAGAGDDRERHASLRAPRSPLCGPNLAAGYIVEDSACTCVHRAALHKRNVDACHEAERLRPVLHTPRHVVLHDKPLAQLLLLSVPFLPLALHRLRGRIAGRGRHGLAVLAIPRQASRIPSAAARRGVRGSRRESDSLLGVRDAVLVSQLADVEPRHAERLGEGVHLLAELLPGGGGERGVCVQRARPAAAAVKAAGVVFNSP